MRLGSSFFTPNLLSLGSQGRELWTTRSLYNQRDTDMLSSSSPESPRASAFLLGTHWPLEVGHVLSPPSER